MTESPKENIARRQKGRQSFFKLYNPELWLLLIKLLSLILVKGAGSTTAPIQEQVQARHSCTTDFSPESTAHKMLNLNSGGKMRPFISNLIPSFPLLPAILLYSIAGKSGLVMWDHTSQ